MARRRAAAEGPAAWRRAVRGTIGAMSVAGIEPPYGRGLHQFSACYAGRLAPTERLEVAVVQAKSSLGGGTLKLVIR